ncbi:MAG: hypothetical protein L0H03_02835 [Rhodococcus sp. (in: high G+C Gram-positive bacteria)]|nr:hypothetical protein [Rhodococcus sp. (in: high G+C Gram-positive bacteria)]
MRPNRYLDDYLHGLEFLSGVYPDDAGAIAEHGIVAALDDDDAFVFLLRLVGPEAPAFADELWQLISGFLNSRRVEELFGSSENAGWRISTQRGPRYRPPPTRPRIQGESA